MVSAWKSSSQYSCRSRVDPVFRSRARNARREVVISGFDWPPWWSPERHLLRLRLLASPGSPVASAAATAPAAAQCDPPAFPTGAGEEVSCNIAITNTVTSTNATTSTITATACLAAAGVLPPAGCVTTVTTSNQLVATVDQCNGIVNGGGSNVTCNVAVTNDVPIGTTTAGATVNQCIGSGTGGGGTSTVVCAPVGSTTSATVTQCNGSGTGGGAPGGWTVR